ncbi:MAG: glycosyltransferase family 1 protein [Actinomycetota bacterium]|nr:glycosyltransferase family 1 protein [Actinomycetota bacterium]
MSTTPLRVGLDLTWLVPGVVGGSEEYTVRLLAGLAELDPPDIDLTVYALDALVEAHPWLAETFPVRTLPLSGRLKPLRVAAQSSWLVQRALRDRRRVLHHAGGFVPALWPGRPTVLTVYDLQPFVMPENFSLAKRVFTRLTVPASVRSADLVITLTATVRADLIRRFGIDANRIRLVAPGLGPRTGDVAPIDEVRARHGIGPRWFVYPAATWPHKNHTVLVDALAEMADPDVELVLTGRADAAEDALVERIRARGMEARVHRVGRIPRPELDALVRGALALLFPSTFEGFGTPVLEAMADGCPVVAADATALPEVVGDAGMLVPPSDVRAWSDAMSEIASDAELRRRLTTAGRRRARAFSARSSATALARAYRTAAGAAR